MFGGHFVWTVSGVIDTIVLLIVALIGCLLVSVYVMTWIVAKVQAGMCKVGLHKYITKAEDKCIHHRIYNREDNIMCSACMPAHIGCKRCDKQKYE